MNCLILKLKGVRIVRLVFCVQCCLKPFKKICSKSYSMAFNGNYSVKSSNIVLLLEKKQMLTGLSKFLSEFP